jgi:transcription elongation factor Elf1
MMLDPLVRLYCMSVYIDRKFLSFVSTKLEQFKQKKTDLYNFRCPYCGDSQKNKLKARGYVYRKSNDYFFVCHNCGKSTTFAKFLEYIDGTTYKQYILERYSTGETGYGSNVKKPDFEQLKGNAHSRFQSTLNDFRGDSTEFKGLERTWRAFAHHSIANLPEGHYARDYIKKRQIPEKFWNEIFFIPKFKDFLDTEFPQHGKDEVPNDDRIVLFYTNEKGEITNVAGRALSDNKIRYVTVKILDEKKLFGLHRLRKQDKVYVLEGQFDSFFIENSVASGDSNLGGVAAVLPEQDVILVYDNEPRNKDIVKQIEKSIDKGYKICLFPESTKGKDINEMIMNGLTMIEIRSIIDNNTFSGLTAKLKFTHWKRC